MSNFGRTSDEDYKKQVIYSALGISTGKQSEFERILRESNKFSQPEIANLVADYSRLYQDYMNRLNSRFQDWMNKAHRSCLFYMHLKLRFFLLPIIRRHPLAMFCLHHNRCLIA